MRTYRFAWAVTTGIVVASCLVYDVAAGGSSRIAALVLVTAFFGGALGFVLTDDRPDRWLWVRRALIWASLGAVAADALVATLRGLGVLVGSLLLVTSPVVVQLAKTQFLAWSTRRTTGPPEALATRDLLRFWDWTTAEVQRSTTSVGRRLVLVEQRSALLDELERRDPGHFRHWVATAVPDRPGDARTRRR